MGLLGPLTAQALGRSPYDDVVQGEGPEDLQEPAQQYDHRGRPINPESKRINRDIIRSHNEVMLVVGVAEPDNPQTEPEVETKRQHFAYEEAIGSRLVWTTKRCIDAVGIFGVTGFRQRILIYKHYATTPLWDIYQAARTDFSPRDMLPGATAALLSQYIDRRWLLPPWVYIGDTISYNKCIVEVLAYAKVHLELFAAFQRLGLISSRQLLPSWKYFIPFTDESPIPAPPPLEDLSCGSVVRWLGGVIISATPFILWAITQRLLRDWRPLAWQRVLTTLPSPIFGGRAIGPFPPPPPSPPTVAADAARESQESTNEDDSDRRGVDEDEDEDEGIGMSSPEPEVVPEPVTSRARRPSIYSVAGGVEDYDSDDDEHEVVSATLISFDVEGTEATDMPQGLWSAELRPSPGPEMRSNGASSSVYLSTMLTRLPSLMAAKVLNDHVLRLLIAPYEAMALRLTARVFRVRHGLSVTDIMSVHPLSGLSLTWVVNLLGAELLHLALCSEVWVMSGTLSRYFHMSEDQWKESGGNDWGEWLGTFVSFEPLF